MSLYDDVSELDEQEVGKFRTKIENVSRGRGEGEIRFDLYLVDRERGKLEPATASVLYFRGFGKYYRPWLEVRYVNGFHAGGSEIDLTLGNEEELFKFLCDMIPRGSHIMVKYPDHRLTAQALMFNIPEAATPIGYLLYVGGCRWYKDWYFAEGFMEGEEKLQGSKPLDEEKFERKTNMIKEGLRQYLDKEPDPSKPEIESTCRELARKILDME